MKRPAATLWACGYYKARKKRRGWLAAVEAFVTEHNRLPARSKIRDKQERGLAQKYGRLRKLLQESNNGDPQIGMLQARVQELERRRTRTQKVDKEALLATVEAFTMEHNRLPADTRTRDKRERYLAKIYRKFRKPLFAPNSSDPQIAMLKAKVQELERRYLPASSSRAPCSEELQQRIEGIHRKAKSSKHLEVDF